MNKVAVTTSGGAGGTAGSLTLNGNILLDDDGAGTPAKLKLNNDANVILAANVTIDTEQGNDGRGGSLDLEKAAFSATTPGRVLTIDTSTTNPGSDAGPVNLGSFGNAGGAFVHQVSVANQRGAGASASGTFLFGDVLLDDNGAGAPSTFSVTGDFVTAAAASVTIDTEQGNTPGVNGGAVSLPFVAGPAGSSLTINTATTAPGRSGGAVTIGGLGTIFGGYVQNLSIDTRAATNGVINLSNNILLNDNGPGAAASLTLAGDVRLGANVTIDTEQGNNGPGGAVNLQNATVSGTAPGRVLTIDTSTNQANANGGAVSLGSFGNGGGSYVHQVAVTTSGGAGGTAGALTLNGNIFLDDDGAGTASNFTLNNTANVLLAANVTIDTEQGNDAQGGKVDLEKAAFSGTAPGRVLTIDASTTNAGSEGGAVNLGSFGNAGGAFVHRVSVANQGGAGASVGGTFLFGDVLLDDNGAGAPASLSVTGDSVSIAANIVIDTEQGNTPGVNGGAVSLPFVAGAPGTSLTINTATTAAGRSGGAVTIGGLGTTFGGYVQTLSIDTRASTNGVISLSNDILLNDNGPAAPASLTLAGDVRLGANVTIDTEQGNNGPGGAVNLQNATVSGTAPGRVLTIDTSTTQANANGGAVSLGSFGNGGGNYVNKVAVTTSGGTGGAAGALTLNGNILLDDDGAGTPANFKLNNAANVFLAADVTIDTEQGNNGRGGSIDLDKAAFSGTAPGRVLTIDTSTTNAGSNAGPVNLGSFGNAGGAFVHKVSVANSGGAGAPAASGTFLFGDVLLDDNGAGAPSTFSVTGTFVTVAATSVTIDTEQGNTPGVNGGAVSLPFVAGPAGSSLTINTATTAPGRSGGAVTIGPVGTVFGGYVQNLSIDTRASTNGVISLSNDILLNDNGPAAPASLTLAGDVRLGRDLFIDTEQGNNGPGGAVNLQNATVSGTAPGRVLTIDTSTTQANANGGAVALGGFGNAGGNFLGQLSVTTSGGTGGTAGTTTLTGSDITTTGTQTYNNNVELAQSTTLTSTGAGAAGNITFNGSVNSQTLGSERSLVVNTQGATTFGDNIGDDRVGFGVSLLSLATDAGGTTVFKVNPANGPTVTTTTTQTYNDNVVLAQNTTLTSTGAAAAGNISFNGAVNSQTAGSERSLVVNTQGATTFGNNAGDDRVGAAIALLSVTTDAGGTTVFNVSATPAVSTTTTQTYGDDVVLAQNTTLTSTGAGAAGDITFNGKVDSQAGGGLERSLVVNTAGTTTFGDNSSPVFDNVGNTFALLSLTTDAPGTTEFNVAQGSGAPTVRTTTFQTYNDSVRLRRDSTFVAMGGNAITFNGNINTAGGTPRSLTVNTTGVTTFGDNVGDDRLGGLSALESVTTNAGGTTLFNVNPAFLPTVTTTTTQTYNDNVVLARNTVLTSTGAAAAGNITFNGSVNSLTVNPERSLLVNTQGAATFGDNVGDDRVGAGVALLSLATDAGGTTVFNVNTANTPTVTTTTTQTYNDDVVLAQNTTLTSTGAAAAGNISFNGAVNSQTAGSERSLTVNTQGATTFGNNAGDDRVGFGVSLLSVTTDANGTTVFNINPANVPSVTTTTTQTYGDAVTLGADTTLTSTGGGAIAFNGTLNGGQALTVNTAGTTTFGAILGGTTPLTSLTTDAGGTTAINTTAITTSGTQTYGDAVSIGANATLTSNNTNITFGGALDADAIGNNRTLAINAPNGSIFIAGSPGANQMFLDFDMTAGANTIVFNGTGPQSVNVNGQSGNTVGFNAPVVFGQNLSVNAGNSNVAFNGAVNSAAGSNSALTVNAGSGGVTFGAVGNTQPIGGLTIAANQVTLNGDIALNGGGTADFRNVSNMLIGPPAVTVDTDGAGGTSNAGAILFSRATNINPVDVNAPRRTLTLDARADGGGTIGDIDVRTTNQGVTLIILGHLLGPDAQAAAVLPPSYDPLRDLLEKFSRNPDESEEEYRRRLARMLQAQVGTRGASGPGTCTAKAPNSLSCD